jgi:stage V sporulation protein B
VPLGLADNLRSGISTAENIMVPKRLALYSATADPLAAFGTVCGMVFPILMFPAAILYALAELLIPELARCAAANSQQRIQYLVRRGLKVTILYGCLFGGLEFLLSKKLCLWLYNNEDAGRYLQMYSLLIPMLYCDAITDAMTKGLGQQKACVHYNIITSAMDVVLLFILLPNYGMLGYFFSFTVTHLLNFALSLRRLLKIAGKVLSPSLPVLSGIATISAIVICAHIKEVTLRCGCYIIVFFSLMTLLRVVGKEDNTWLRNIILHKKPDFV